MVLKGGTELLNHPDVLQFYQEIVTDYHPPSGKDIALFLPCSAKKPYSESRTHRCVRSTLRELGTNEETRIHELIVSEPLGIVPRECEMKYPAAHYDVVLDSWFPVGNIPGVRKKFGNDVKRIRRYKQENHKAKDEIIETLAERVAKFLIRTEEHYTLRFGFVRSTQREILEKAAEFTGIKIDFVLSKEFISELASKKGRMYWIMNGMRCKESLGVLKCKLAKII